MAAQESPQKAKDWLQRKHDEIMGYETEALLELKKGNVDAYNALMRRKAEELSDIAAQAKPQLTALNEPEKDKIAAELNRYSASARTALKLNSVFYMSALLYPDVQKEGEPDNMQAFINQLA